MKQPKIQIVPLTDSGQGAGRISLDNSINQKSLLDSSFLSNKQEDMKDTLGSVHLPYISKGITKKLVVFEFETDINHWNLCV